MIMGLPLSHWSDGAAKIYDFLQGSLPQDLSFTRASNAWYFNSSGILTVAGTNVARFDYGTPGSVTPLGLLIEEARTNVALWNRDLTNAAWALTSATTALDQVGIDGVSNSASSMTATGANATALQTITAATSTRAVTFYLKRISGSGTIQVTQNGGTTWTTVTLTNQWQRFSGVTASVLNPQIGIRIVTSGDVIAFDAAQLESVGGAGGFATSVILTTTASVTRASDNLGTALLTWFNSANGSFIVDGVYGGTAPGLGQNFLASFSDSTNNNRIASYIANVTPTGNIIKAAASSTFTTANTATVGAAFKCGMVYDATSKLCFNGGTVASSAIALPTGINRLDLGRRQDGTRQANSWLRQFRYWNYSLPNGQLQRLTA